MVIDNYFVMSKLDMAISVARFKAHFPIQTRVALRKSEGFFFGMRKLFTVIIRRYHRQFLITKKKKWQIPVENLHVLAEIRTCLWVIGYC